uniref:EB domain-containing protein n=1 Tax=Caenorhabditis tropicalis TaxID=1561998 RepID=A0A1I7URA8_9PELO
MQTILILSLLVVGVSSYRTFSGVVGGSKSLPCVAPCAPGQACIQGVCQSIPHFNGQRAPRGDTGDLCSTNADCLPSGTCGDGVCEVDNGFGGRCSTGTQCPDHYDCKNGMCRKASRHFAMSCPIRCPDGQVCVNGHCIGGF